MDHELLNGLTSAQVDELLSLGTRMTVPSGGTLFRLGDPADCLFLIERGQIRLTFPMLVRGREVDVFIEEKSPGETVGRSALVPPYRFTLFATAVLETDLIALQRDMLREVCERSPSVGCRIALNLSYVVAQRMQVIQVMWIREMERTFELELALAAESQ